MLPVPSKADFPFPNLPPFQPHDKSGRCTGSTAHSEEDKATHGCEVSRKSLTEWILKTDHRTIELFLNPLSFGYMTNHTIRLDKSVRKSATHLNLPNVWAFSHLVEDIRVSVDQLTRDLFLSASVNTDLPAFSSPETRQRPFISVLAGPAIYIRSGNSVHCPGDLRWDVRHIEVQVTCDESRVGFEPAQLAVFEDSSKLELLELLPLGTGENRSRIHRGLSCLDSHQLPVEVVSVEQHAFRFRCKEEASLWKVAMEDAVGCSRARWKELVDLSPNQIPRGYRSQYSRLKALLSAATLTDANVWEKCLECIEYFQKRLSECHCRKSVDINKEDLVVDTRQLILTKLGK